MACLSGPGVRTCCMRCLFVGNWVLENWMGDGVVFYQIFFSKNVLPLSLIRYYFRESVKVLWDLLTLWMRLCVCVRERVTNTLVSMTFFFQTFCALALKTCLSKICDSFHPWVGRKHVSCFESLTTACIMPVAWGRSGETCWQHIAHSSIGRYAIGNLEMQWRGITLFDCLQPSCSRVNVLCCAPSAKSREGGARRRGGWTRHVTRRAAAAAAAASKRCCDSWGGRQTPEFVCHRLHGSWTCGARLPFAVSCLGVSVDGKGRLFTHGPSPRSSAIDVASLTRSGRLMEVGVASVGRRCWRLVVTAA